MVRLPCGSPSMRSTFFPACASPIPKLAQVVIFPTLCEALHKLDKSRIVPVMKPTDEFLRQYIEGAGLSSPAYSRNTLFTNRGNKPLTRAGVTYILKKYASQAQAAGVKDISDEITPHWLRHSKAMHLLQSGVNLVYIRDLLGHSDISTTEIYARADEKMKRKALMEVYNSPTSDGLPTWKQDKALLDWLKSTPLSCRNGGLVLLEPDSC